MKVTVRKHALTKGRHRLFLDYYPPIVNPKTNKQTGYENLKLFVYDNPATPTERNHNRTTMELATTICASRQLELQAQKHGMSPSFRKQESFITYFRKLADQQRGLNWHNWDSSVRYFQLFADGADLSFAELDLFLCEQFKRFLLSEPKLRESRRGIGHNSALSYFNKFRTALKQAWREKLISDDLHALSPGLKEIEAEVEYLTMDEIRKLLETPVNDDLYKRVILLAILTGLRFCDIKYLTWKQVRGERDSFYLQFRQRKTYKPQHVYISNQAFDLMGERGEPEETVFPKVNYNYTRDMLKVWPKEAGINKHLTFSCLRHTYATLQLDHGTDIYTISKLLGHRHLKTTQRYTRVVDKAKKEAANRIVFDF
ncbi:tyrosine-type recombinase/integrase [Mucilaginibacter sp. 3215]|uniref:tyrosine-type recombinase/integrase n=1 Tax=Mucilaginibacter sp. 3215 TaxID=3373912 RepID=UPI003D1ADEAA